MNFKYYSKQDVRMDYYKPLSKEWWLDWALKSEQYYLRRYVRLLRSEEYYIFIKPNTLLRMFYARKKNKLGARLGFFIPAGCFGEDLKISHYGSIIVNPHARIGKGCTTHGNCCIGNKGGGKTNSFENDSPIIGDNVDIGQGAQILGPVHISDGVIIGAGSIVNKSIETPGAVVVGVPAKVISHA